MGQSQNDWTGARRKTVAAAVLMAATSLASTAHAEWTVTGFAGVMTNDVWEDAIQLLGVDYLDSGLVGVGVGKEFARYGQLTFGFELQAVQHFGTQDNFEINTPLTVRYNRESDVLSSLESLAFGLGLSWASEKPQTEVDRNGDTNQTMFYWMGELQFDLPNTDLDLVTRIHHRSDGYGVWEVDSGSNALVIGLKRTF